MPLTSYRALLRARPGSSLAVILHFRYRIFFPSLTHSLSRSLAVSLPFHSRCLPSVIPLCSVFFECVREACVCPAHTTPPQRPKQATKK